jgi:hypothetical protein
MLFNDFLNRIEDSERDFIGKEFLAPVVGAARVLVRIAGVICQLRVSYGLPDDFTGWAIFQSISMNEAVCSRRAKLTEIAHYLEMLPPFHLILVQSERTHWLALPASRGDIRFLFRQPVRVWLVNEGLQQFDSIIARFDGRSFWFDHRDPLRNPSLAAYLRRQMRLFEAFPALERSSLHKSGLSREEKDAFRWVLHQRREAERDQIEDRFADALTHAGAKFHSYSKRGGAYVVRYDVDGREVVSTVKDDDFSIITAGLCLQGQDSKFDLTSLVSVMREGRQRNVYGV